MGGGHAHLHVLRDAALRPWPRTEMILVSPSAFHHYSGMVPGFLQGQYTEKELRFDLSRLCRLAGATLVRGFADQISARAGYVEARGRRIPFDVASLDVGSAPAGMDVPGVVEHACTVRPMSRAVALRERLDEHIRSAPRTAAVRLCVVGGGAAGVEVAMALHRRIELAGRTAAVSVFERDRLLPGYSARARRRMAAILRARGVAVREGCTVAAVGAENMLLAGGEAVNVDLVVWLTGAAAPPVLARSDLPLGPDGFFRVDATLRSVDGMQVWGAGDCVTLANHAGVPKAGVYAVREAPILAANLRAATQGGAFRSYHPQHSFLALLNTADGKALLRWRGWLSHSRWAAWLKDRIDRRFVAQYQSPRS